MRIAALGLRPETLYRHVVELMAVGHTVQSDTVAFKTGTPPAIVTNLRLSPIVGAPAYAYTVISPLSLSNDTAVIAAFDTSGQVGWYRLFAEGVPSVVGQQMPNGNYLVFLGGTQGFQPTFGWFVEVSPDGEEVRRYTAAPPFYTDNHDLLLSLRDTTIAAVTLFGYELRPTDLTSLGGPANALVAGHVILREGLDGQVQFMWNAWDHFGVQDWIEPTGVNPPLDFDHPNSLDYDLDGNYIVSFRHMGMIAKINSQTGDIMWRLGGRTNQFTFVNDPFGGFSAQHSAHVLPNGHLLIYDNGLRHPLSESRAVEYQLDTVAKTATMVWQFRHSPPISTPAVGSVQRYANGSTLVGFGFLGVVSEVDANSNVRWEGQLMFTPSSKGIFYRAQEVRSLYQYEVP